MNNERKISSKYLLTLIFTVLFFSVTLNVRSNYPSPHNFYNAVGSAKDTTKPVLPIIKDTIPKDSTIKDSTWKDSLDTQTDTMNIKVSKDSLDAPISYSAADSIVMEVPSKIITLYNKANTKQKDLTLDAYKIMYDQSKQIVVATYGKDTAGKMIQRPKMLQADNTIESDSMVYNLKNQKGLTMSSYTQSGEMYVYGERFKKISPEEFYASRGRFTTCNLDTPHFAFRANKVDIINKKFAITGPVHPEFEGVPIPIYIPFGFFPLAQGRHTGFLPPQFTSSGQMGLGLTGLGWYQVFSDNFDAKLAADLYSYGGWAIYLDPEYLVRYRFRGQLNFSFQDTKILSTSGTQDVTDSKNYKLTWSHTVDSKARPGTTFSANVNLASMKYNQYVINNPTLNYQNSLGSSISYSKTFNDGKYNLTASANHSQNSNNGLISITLPNLGFTATTIYPFQKKELIGTPKWYEKLGIGLTTNFNNQANLYDSTPNFFKKLIDTFAWGAHHSLPITLSLPQLGPLQISPGMSFQQNWYQRKNFIKYNTETTGMDTIGQKGFFTENSASFSLGLSTAIFGTFNKFGSNSSILGIRHVMRPTVSLSYSPNLAGKDYYSVTNDSTNITRRESVYAGNTFAPFAEGRFGGMSFALDNTLEMKVKSKSDTSESGVKKVKLLDAFGFSGSYNYLADSNKLSQINIYARSTLFGKINITASTTLDPYVRNDTTGTDLKNTYAWQQKKFSLGTITQGNLAISTSFKAKPKDPDAENQRKKDLENQIPMTAEEQQAMMNDMATHAAQYADFNVDWSLNLSFSLNFSKTQTFTGVQTLINAGLNWSGDFNLTPKWKLGMSSMYDVKLEKINSLSMSISRDMHCWQMSVNVIPIGLTRSFNITISPKASILNDLKVTRSKYFYTE